MGYTRVIQAGDTIEVYEYEKNYVPPRHRDYLQNTRRASSNRTATDTVITRSARSVKRAKSAFIRVVLSNVQRQSLPSFITLTIERETPLEVGYAYLADFWMKIRKIHGRDFRYIGVPEWQQRGVLHFHFLVWGLPKSCTDNKTERSTRNFQRQWHKGFCDVRNATYSSGRLAGYLAKYLTEALNDTRLGNRRAYTCSRNILRPNEAGTNSLSEYLDELIPVEKKVDRTGTFDTLWLGVCKYTKYTINN